MAADYTHLNLTEVEDSAPKFGFEERQEARFANEALGTAQTGVSYHRIKPGRRQGFGHNHEDAEEVYVVLSGSGRMKLDDTVVDLVERDAVRVPGPVIRAFEAGEDGLDVVACGPLRGDDRGEVFMDWWSD